MGERVVRWKRVLCDGERLAVQITRFVEAVLSCEGHGEVVELSGDLGMVATEDRLLDEEPFAEQCFGAGAVVALQSAGRQVAEVDGDVVLVRWMAGAEDREGPFEQLLGFGGAAELEEGGACTARSWATR